MDKVLLSFKSEDGFDVYINTNNLNTLIMKECGPSDPWKVTVAWTGIGGAGDTCKVHKNTADKIKRTLSYITRAS